MAIKAIAHSYWRLIKAGTRTFESVPVSVQADVIALARTDVENGVITAEQFKEFIGQDF